MRGRTDGYIPGSTGFLQIRTRYRNKVTKYLYSILAQENTKYVTHYSYPIGTRYLGLKVMRFFFFLLLLRMCHFYEAVAGSNICCR